MSWEIHLNRGGEDYESMDKTPLTDFREEEIGEISQASSVILYSGDLDESRKGGFEALREIPEEKLLQNIEEAADYFSSDAGGMDYDEYCRKVTSLTGLPISDVKRAGEMLEGAMRGVDETVEAQTPNQDLSLYDAFSSEGNFVYAPEGRNLGIITPSNHPAVNALWLSGLGMKYPTMIRPSNDEPLTPKRVTDSLYEAGLPENSLHFLPGDREFGNTLVNETDKGIVFGGPDIKGRYQENPDVKAFGPGNSKIYIDEDFVGEDMALDLAKNSMMKDGGRGCINISQVVVEDGVKDFAEELAEEVREIEPVIPYQEEAQIPAMPMEEAKRFNKLLQESLEGGAADFTYDEGSKRLVKKDGAAYLRPTVTYIPQGEGHPLFNEFPFQYSSVTDYSEGILSDSLTLTMLTNDKDKVEEALMNPTVEKVYVGVPSCDIDIKEPHEGYISDFLYEKKAFREA
ncbi:MAG: aldehyde dehydrogenase family protein [Candidatus Aenigmatarchaeota archaeon]